MPGEVLQKPASDRSVRARQCWVECGVWLYLAAMSDGRLCSQPVAGREQESGRMRKSGGNYSPDHYCTSVSADNLDRCKSRREDAQVGWQPLPTTIAHTIPPRTEYGRNWCASAERPGIGAISGKQASNRQEIAYSWWKTRRPRRFFGDRHHCSNEEGLRWRSERAPSVLLACDIGALVRRRR